MIHFEYTVSIRGSVLLYVQQKMEDFSLSLYLPSQHTNFIIYPLCFLTVFCCDITSQLFSRERGGESDKKTDLYYSLT